MRPPPPGRLIAVIAWATTSWTSRAIRSRLLLTRRSVSCSWASSVRWADTRRERAAHPRRRSPAGRARSCEDHPGQRRAAREREHADEHARGHRQRHPGRAPPIAVERQLEQGDHRDQHHRVGGVQQPQHEDDAADQRHHQGGERQLAAQHQGRQLATAASTATTVIGLPPADNAASATRIGGTTRTGSQSSTVAGRAATAPAMVIPGPPGQAVPRFAGDAVPRSAGSHVTGSASGRTAARPAGRSVGATAARHSAPTSSSARAAPSATAPAASER